MTQPLLAIPDTLTPHASNLGEILLVDPAPGKLEMLVECFSAYGFELTVAHDEDSALECCEHSPPDLILLDIMIPGKGGFELCRRFKEHETTKDIPVIFMKDQADNVSTVKGFSVGAVDYVNKPLQLEEILARVTAHLKIRNLQEQLEGTIVTLQQEVVERKRAEEAAHAAMLHTQEANDRMRRDLEAAARVQQSLLPDAVPNIPGVTLGWIYRPCAELGGDSLNVFPLSNHELGLYVLDVTGHGVPASLLSVTLSRVLIPRSDLSCLFTKEDKVTSKKSLVSPAEVATRLNHMFPMSKGDNQYFTLLYGIFNTKEKTFRYVCAGHPAPILIRKGQEVTLGEARSLPIGLFDDEQYEECMLQLAIGSRLYLYSDGVLEAMNSNREIFGETRLKSVIESHQAMSLQASVETIGATVSDWTTVGQVHDDLSILALECHA